ncbi:hypothetical protein HK098_004702 [Nowakowskiella sp. JEL0407]|nr:hypothetical protein HK098_004702 [Nowakowskiella sp. JEL0407]
MNMESFNKVLVDKDLFEVLRKAASKGDIVIFFFLFSSANVSTGSDLCTEQVIFIEELSILKKRFSDTETEEFFVSRAWEKMSVENLKGFFHESRDSNAPPMPNLDAFRNNNMNDDIPSNSSSKTLATRASSPGTIGGKSSNRPAPLEIPKHHLEQYNPPVNSPLYSPHVSRKASGRKPKYDHSLDLQRSILSHPEIDAKKIKSDHSRSTLYSHIEKEFIGTYVAENHTPVASTTTNNPHSPPSRNPTPTPSTNTDFVALKMHCSRLVEAFILVGSPLELNISATCRSRILEKFNSGDVAVDMFDDAREEIVSTLVLSEHVSQNDQGPEISAWQADPELKISHPKVASKTEPMDTSNGIGDPQVSAAARPYQILVVSIYEFYLLSSTYLLYRNRSNHSIKVRGIGLIIAQTMLTMLMTPALVLETSFNGIYPCFIIFWAFVFGLPCWIVLFLGRGLRFRNLYNFHHFATKEYNKKIPKGTSETNRPSACRLSRKGKKYPPSEPAFASIPVPVPLESGVLHFEEGAWQFISRSKVVDKRLTRGIFLFAFLLLVYCLVLQSTSPYISWNPMKRGSECNFEQWIYLPSFAFAGFFACILAPTMVIMLSKVQDTQGIQVDLLFTAVSTALCIVIYFLWQYDIIPSFLDWGIVGPSHLT